MEFHSKIYADGMGPAYDYTPEGRLSRRTWARGLVTDYAYDAWGNLTNTVYSDGTPMISLDYDAMGRQTSAITEGVSTNLYFYSAYGELTNEVQNGVSIARSYDTYSRPTGYLLCDSASPREINYIYDASGHFSAVEFDFNAEPQSRRVEYGYLPGTDLVTGYTSGDFSRSVSYEPHRERIAAVTNSFNSSTYNSSTPPLTIISSFAYANDAAGRRISRIDTFDGGVTTNVFGYNIRSEVTSAAMGTNSYEYAYDPIGNRQTASLDGAATTYTANSLNQYTSIASQLFPLPSHLSYDSDCNLLTNGVFSYAWDAENRMVAAHSNDVCVVSNVYDTLSRRIRKITPRSTHSFLYDDWNPAQEAIVSVSNSGTTNRYFWGMDISDTLQGAGGIGGLLVYANGPELRVPLYDGHGNVVSILNEEGCVVARFEYDALGGITKVMGCVAAGVPFRFSTKYFDKESGLYYYTYRFYSPGIGRWMNSDPIGERGSANLYCFVKNNPISYIDFLGLSWQDQDVDDWNDLGNIIGISSGIPNAADSPLLFPEQYPIPPSFPSRKTPAIFDELPDCPCEIPLDCSGKPTNEQVADGWTEASETIHAGGAWEIRKWGGSLFPPAGQQCLFDSEGKLINIGSSPGTPDYFYPWLTGSPLWIGHAFFDWLPWKLNTLTLGNEVAEQIDHRRHPPNQGKDCDGNPCPPNDGSGHSPTSSK